MQTASSVLALTAATPEAAMTGKPRSQEHVGIDGALEVARLSKSPRSYRGVMRRKSRSATNALVSLDQEKIVLGHIHPRWLREAVAVVMGHGVDVDQAMVLVMRAAGTDLWRMQMNLYLQTEVFLP